MASGREEKLRQLEEVAKRNDNIDFLSKGKQNALKEAAINGLGGQDYNGHIGYMKNPKASLDYSYQQMKKIILDTAKASCPNNRNRNLL